MPREHTRIILSSIERTTVKTLIVIFILLLVVPELQATGNSAYFYYRNENKPLLHYYRFQNVFDSSRTTYVFGEVAMVSNGSIRRIPPDTSVALDQKIAGLNSTGEDTLLRTYSRTQDFSLIGGGVLSWLSELTSFRSPCNPTTVHPVAGEGPNIPTQAWGMLDRTEFVVELVRADSYTRLVVLDSIGVAPPQAGIFVDTRYGTTPQSVLKQYRIPLDFDGVKAYLRVSPRRYGPTPYGMTLCKIKNWVNFSARYNSTGTSYIPEQEYINLSNTFFAEILDYCDSVKNATGWLPERIYEGIGFSLAENTILNSRYYTEHTDSLSGQKVWIEIPAWVWTKKGALPKFEGNLAEVVSVQKIIPNPASGHITLILIARLERQVVIRLYSTEGKAVQLWSGTLQEGENGVMVSSASLAVGVYTMIVEDPDGKRLGSAPLIVNR